MRMAEIYVDAFASSFSGTLKRLYDARKKFSAFLIGSTPSRMIGGFGRGTHTKSSQHDALLCTSNDFHARWASQHTS
jgi:hypothetical protein